MIVPIVFQCVVRRMKSELGFLFSPKLAEFDEVNTEEREDSVSLSSS